MSRLAGALAVLLAAAGPAATQQAAADDPAAVVHALFDALRARDTTAMRALFHPEARMLTTGTDSSGAPVVRTFAVGGWLANAARTTAYIDERLSDVETRVSGGLATVWAAYDLYVDGAFRHCGVDAFQLVRTSQGWRIIQVADTRRTEGCAAGPPS